MKKYNSFSDVFDGIIETIDKAYIDEKSRHYADKYNASNSLRFLGLALQLINAPYSAVLQKLLSNPNADFDIVYSSGHTTRTTTAKILLLNNNICFRPRRGKDKTTEVMSIDNIQYRDNGDIDEAIKNILELYSATYENSTAKNGGESKDDSLGA